MNNHNLHANIAYIAYRLITGRKIASLYKISDILESRNTDITSHLDNEFIRDFDEKHREYTPGYSNNCNYNFTSQTGDSFDIFINEQNFVLHIRGSSSYFIGNIWDDKIYIHDHRASSHCRYKILKCVEEDEKAEKF
ncbi:MAG: hypothetical protein AB1632_06570 [Nitrospirota bacterium]